ncbi:asparagine synthase-related protein [uncultured Tistrella sp.]|uniref:asparagine synthase-related protein n=1 Tax=Tistrella mobilis TaxID=171437 RepID=UPI000C0A05A2|nr:asparagine synthase-related protein [uncultured Tistrella sp.]MAM74280.1 asparagine synthase [Tistrella sp.]
MNLLFAHVGRDYGVIDHRRSAAAVSASGLTIRRHHDDGIALLLQTGAAGPSSRPPRPLPCRPGPDGSVSLFDGALYNGAELAAMLDHPAGTEADTLAAAALARQGEAAPAAWVGDFAVIRWDPARRELIAAIDQMGGRPLFYCCRPDGILLASRIDTLLAHPAVPQGLDPEILGLTLVAAAHRRPNRTVHTAIDMLPPGHGLTWSDGRLRLWRYWQPDHTRRIRFRRDDDYVEAARHLLDQAVACRLPAGDEPLLCHLTAGLDSTAVATTAARLRGPAPLHTVTVRPQPMVTLPEAPGLIQDEWDGARLVPPLYPNMVPHHVVAPEPTGPDEDPGGRFHRRDWPMSWLFSDGLYHPTPDLARELGARVVLTGEGGNLSLSWDGRLAMADQLRRLHLGALASNLAGRARQGKSPLREFLGWALLPALPPELRLAVKRLRGRPELWRERSALAPALGERLAEGRLTGHAPRRSASRDADMRIEMIEKNTFLKLAHSGHMWVDPADRRHPLTDVRLVDFCLGLPPGQYLNRGRDRWLARRVLAGRLPQAVLDERRTGREDADWFHRMTMRRDWMMAEIARCEASPLAREVLDLPKIRRLVEDWPADATEASRPETMLPLLHAVGRGLRVGQFICRAEGGNG